MAAITVLTIMTPFTLIMVMADFMVAVSTEVIMADSAVHSIIPTIHPGMGMDMGMDIIQTEIQ